MASSPVKFLVAFILAVLKVPTVNLSQLANALNGTVKRASNDRRLQRFFAEFEGESALIARLILRVLPDQAPWIISLDRTTWQFGTVTINILLAGIVYRGIAFPLGWLL